jgi:hypothetical protein
VTDWYDNVYMPIVNAVREENILQDFPGRTEADLYLWIIDHKHFLGEEYGYAVSPDQAATHYAERYAPRQPLRRARTAMGQLFHMFGNRTKIVTLLM